MKKLAEKQKARAISYADEEKKLSDPPSRDTGKMRFLIIWKFNSNRKPRMYGSEAQRDLV